jgi:hypothetical protein
MFLCTGGHLLRLVTATTSTYITALICAPLTHNTASQTAASMLFDYQSLLMGRVQDCSALLERIRRDQDALQAGAYAVSSCPICLEEFDAEGGELDEQSGSPGARGGPSNGSKSNVGGQAQEYQTAAATVGAVGVEEGAEVEGKTPVPERGEADFGARQEMDQPLLAAVGGKATSSGSGTPSGSAAGAAAAQRQPTRRPLVVTCGHVFCEPCLNA